MKETSGEPKNLLGLEGDRPRPGSAGGLPRALRAGQSFSGKECLARRGRPRPGPAWFARLTGPLAPPPGLAPDRGAPRSGGTRRPSPITQKLVRPVPDSWRRAPLQEKKKKEREKGKSKRGSEQGPRRGTGYPRAQPARPPWGQGPQHSSISVPPQRSFSGPGGEGAVQPTGPGVLPPGPRGSEGVPTPGVLM